MKIGVRYLAQLRQAAGRPAEEVELARPSSVQQLLIVLAERWPNLRRALLTRAGSPQPTLLVFVGDEQAGPDVVVRDGDVITLLTPVAGGGA